MTKPFLAAFGVALAVIGLLVWQGFISTAGNHLVPAGKIGKIRSQKVDDKEVIVIVDFSLKNDADIAMVVRTIEATLETADGSKVNGSMIAVADLANFFRNYSGLNDQGKAGTIGEQYNPPLRPRDSVAGHQTVDRMVGIRFDVAEETVENRKGIMLRIEDITGPVLELKAK